MTDARYIVRLATSPNVRSRRLLFGAGWDCHHNPRKVRPMTYSVAADRAAMLDANTVGPAVFVVDVHPHHDPAPTTVFCGYCGAVTPVVTCKCGHHNED
jgi:hypothetical protein